MKKLWILNIFVLALLASCSDDDDGSPAPDDGIAVNSDDFIGVWEVTRFIDDGDDETDDLDDFTLEFLDNNDLVISNGSQSITASWSLSSDGKRLTLNIDDDDANQIDPNDELEELDDDPWIFVSLTGQVMNLLEYDDDDDDDDRDELTLTRV
ncbi:MAG: hypothetical protein MI921_01705 [Cytophagales bacterium]|nr:hypothetical protein [Cytophagales bacterium]